MKIRLFLDDNETERYSLVMVPPSSVEYEYNPRLSKIMKKKCVEHKHAMEELRGIMKHSDDMSSSSEEDSNNIGLQRIKSYLLLHRIDRP